jgi:hypothetical protein
VLDEVNEWLAACGVEPTAHLQLINDTPWSTVLRVPTADPDLYLKQGQPLQEFEVPPAIALADRFGLSASLRRARCDLGIKSPLLYQLSYRLSGRL